MTDRRPTPDGRGPDDVPLWLLLRDNDNDSQPLVVDEQTHPPPPP